MKSKLIRLLSVFGATAILNASVTNTTLAESYSINSYGVIQDSDSNVVIDADDIRQNYQAIQQLKKQLAALENKSLQWSDDLQTYVIVTYELDENGDIIYEETIDSTTGETVKTPKVSNTEAIGALGTADPTMVVENRTFSSLYAKTVYKDSDTAKSPGVQQNGTLIDVLQNGWHSDDLNSPYYALNDTEGTGSSTRAKDETVDTSGRTHMVTVSDEYVADSTLAGNNGSIDLANNESSRELSINDTSLILGANESIILPAGYYSSSVTVNNGVVDQTNTVLSGGTYTASGSATGADDGSISLSDIGENLTSLSDLTVGVNESVTLPAGYYSDSVTINNGVVNRGTASTILTSTDNKITLPAGYYEGVTVSTDITSLAGTVTYTHHQCSNTENNATYTDDIIGTSNTASVNETTINGQIVATSQGGCYTTPYYKYTYSTKEEKEYVSSVTRPSYNPISGGWNMVTFTYDKNGNQTGATTLYACNEYDQSTTVVGKYTVNVTKTGYGVSVPTGGQITATYYLKTCGHSNGELLSVTITY